MLVKGVTNEFELFVQNKLPLEILMHDLPSHSIEILDVVLDFDSCIT